jgi:hypothetical protein
MSASENVPQTTVPPEPTDVRFGMRGLLLTMTAVAIGAGTLGSYFRNLPPDARGEVIAMWAICGVMVLSLVGYHARTRLRLERLAGRTICAITPRAKFGFAVKPWITILIGFMWIAGGLYYLAMIALAARRGPTVGREPFALSLIPCVVSGAFISFGIITIWWYRSVQLREEGVLQGLRLLRWTHITNHRWENGAVLFQGVDQRHRDVQLAAVVTAEQREAVDRLLARKFSAADRALKQAGLGGDSNLEEQLLVPIRVGYEVTLRGIASAFTVYVIFGTFVVAIRPWGTPSREFMAGVGISAVCFVVSLAIRARRAGSAGAPIIRLTTRPDWPSVLVAVLLAIGCYFINQQLVFPNVFIAGVLGVGSGAGAAAFAEMLLTDKFDLCENGVMLIRWTFLPWAGVRLVKWNRSGNGRLVLRSGWRRVAAKVPAEHRDVVDRVLREKVEADSKRNSHAEAGVGG